MVLRAGIYTVKAVGNAEPVSRTEPAADARQQAFRRTLAAMIGSSTQGEVLARLRDGSFLVRVAGTAARMPLPPGVTVGTTLPMTVLAASPHPTFQVAGGAVVDAALAFDDPAALRAGDLEPAAQQQARTATQSGAPAPGTASLSAAARMLASVLQAGAGAPAAAALHGAAPLVGTAPPLPAELAQQLAQLVSESGLFYESHVAEWAEGKRSLAELAREPQMQARPGAPEHDPQAAAFINMQLASQEQARITWQGQFAPGLPLEWEVRRDAPDRQDQHGDDAAPPAWRSGLRLRLPRLGEVAATVVIAGEQLHIRLEAGSEQASSALRAHAPALASALGAAGIGLDSLHIGAAAQGR